MNIFGEFSVFKRQPFSVSRMGHFFLFLVSLPPKNLSSLNYPNASFSGVFVNLQCQLSSVTNLHNLSSIITPHPSDISFIITPHSSSIITFSSQPVPPRSTYYMMVHRQCTYLPYHGVCDARETAS